MKPRTLLILALVVLALGGFIWFYERDLPGSEERREMATQLLGGLTVSDVLHVSLAFDDHEVTLERAAPPESEDSEDLDSGDETAGEEDAGAPAATASMARWRLLAPLEAKADAAAVESLLGDLTGLEKKRTLEEPDPAELGLEPPRATLTLESAADETVVEVGEALPVSGDRVVRLAGEEEVHVVRGEFFGEVTREPGEWRSREVFDAANRDIVRVRFTRPEEDEEVVLRRQGERRFRLEEPVEDAADREEANKLVLTMTDLTVEEFRDGASPAELGLAEPATVVEAGVRGLDGPLRLELGDVVDAEEGLYGARVGDQMVTLAAGDLLELLGRPPAGWRSPRWTELEIFQIDALDVEEAGAETLRVERDQPNWRRGEEPILYAPVRALLLAVTSTRAERILGAGEAGAEALLEGEPELTLTLVVEEEGEEPSSEVLTAYPAVDGEVPVTTDSREAVLTLSSETFEQVAGAVDDLRKAPVAEQEESPDINVEVKEGDSALPGAPDG